MKNYAFDRTEERAPKGACFVGTPSKTCSCAFCKVEYAFERIGAKGIAFLGFSQIAISRALEEGTLRVGRQAQRIAKPEMSPAMLNGAIIPPRPKRKRKAA